MPITINGSGTVTGISAGGLPDDCITTADIAANAVTFAKIGTTEQGQLCKAWVNCNGNGTTNSSYNCSSITDEGVGMYRFNFTNSLADKNYVVVGSCVLGTTAAVNGITHFGGSDFAGTTAGSQTASAFRFGTYPNDTRADIDWISVAVFR
jgi:hypothetical protein